MLTLRIPTPPPPAAEPEEPPVVTKPPELRPALTTPKFGRGVTALSVSWMHGRFEAVAIQRGEVTGTWQLPRAEDDPSRFGDLVKQAAAHTGYRGTTVSVLLAHPRLVHQLLETPPAKGAALRAVVQRQVDRLKVFDGEAAWGFQPALPTKNSASVLAHLFPRTVLEQLVKGAETAGFHLTTVLPATVALQSQLARLPLKSEEVALIAGDTGNQTTVVVGRGDGQVLLCRSLDTGRGEGAAGLAVDLNRTVLFVSQQFGTPVGSVWLFGPETSSRLAELQAQLQVPVKVSPEPYHALFWAEEALRLPGTPPPNLLSTEQRQAPQRRVLLRVAIAVTLILLLAAGASVGIAEVLVRREQGSIREMETRIAELQKEHQHLQQVRLEFGRQAQIARTILEDRPAPIPVWFLAYLGEALPPELVLTNLLVRREGNEWQVRLAGSLQPSTNAPPPGVLTRNVDEFKNRLGSGPFHLTLVPPTAPPDPPQLAQSKAAFGAIASWASRLAPPPTGPRIAPESETHFVLEGRMR